MLHVLTRLGFGIVFFFVLFFVWSMEVNADLAGQAAGYQADLLSQTVNEDGHDEPGGELGGEHGHDSHGQKLHFLHPLVVESPLPENEIRLGAQLSNLPGGDGEEFEFSASIELAPVDWFSVEVSVPFSFLNPDAGDDQARLGNVRIGAKFATFALADDGILLAAGVELGLPTGNEDRGIGNDHVVEVEPWIGAGFQFDQAELIVGLGAGFPTNQNGDREADVEMEWGVSFLYPVVEEKIAFLLELDGVSIFGEEEDGYNSVSITPGLRIFPFGHQDMSLGLGVRMPLTDDRDSHVQGIFTIYLHF